MAAFRGWSAEAFTFYEGLEADTTKDYWQSHRHTYDNEVVAPFEAFAELVADEFGPLMLARPYRDTRFSNDKTPYKTRQYAMGRGQGGQSYYVELSAAGLVAGAGFWMMADDQLARYRAAVDDDRTGEELAAIVSALRPEHDIEFEALKTAPRGFPKDHPRVALLRHKSLAAVRRFDRARWQSTAVAADRILGTWRAAEPLITWLAGNVGPSTEPPRERYRGRVRS